jgi:cytochrome oxidase Cu insertion factor (SCO1/SenC/PrrC family)
MVKRSVLVAALMILAAACQGKPDLGGQGLPKIRKGVAAPGFTLPSAQGERVSLADYREKRPVLLYFSMGPG